jgi:hypothetical protein
MAWLFLLHKQAFALLNDLIQGLNFAASRIAPKLALLFTVEQVAFTSGEAGSSQLIFILATCSFIVQICITTDR